MGDRGHGLEDFVVLISELNPSDGVSLFLVCPFGFQQLGDVSFNEVS